MPGGGLDTKVWLQDRVWSRNADGGPPREAGNLVLRKSGRVDSWAFKVPRPQRAEDSSGDNALFFGKYRPPEALQCEHSHQLAPLQSSAAHLLSNQGDHPSLCKQTHPHTS